MMWPGYFDWAAVEWSRTPTAEGRRSKSLLPSAFWFLPVAGWYASGRKEEKEMIEQIGGWRVLFGILLVPGAVAIPIGLTIADVISKSGWLPGVALSTLQLLAMAILWLLML